MNWPTLQDYNEAVQNPQFSFSDPDLKAGSPVLDPRGLPKAITGGFATVYEMHCAGRRWAVRCFSKQVGDQERRYTAISRHLQAVRPGCTVGFQFLSEGIRVRGRWYPVLKMDWVEGEPIEVYIENHLGEPQVLQSLARQWIALMSSLRQAQVAHGDLQHGNVLVSTGALRLVDYDGMYVPALAGLTSNEKGHDNYQHPSRTRSDFGLGLDNFSAWVVFISISAVALEPRLWDGLKAGDECLLFRREDFEHPTSSRAFKALTASGKPELQALAAQFRSLLSLPLHQIPGLDGAPIQPAASKRAGTTLPEWVSSHVSAKAPLHPESLPEADRSKEVVSADWLFDHLIDRKPPIRVWESISLHVERTCFGSAVLVSGLGLGGFLSGNLNGWLAFAWVTMTWLLFGARLAYRFQSLGLPAEKRELELRLAEAIRTSRQCELLVQMARAERNRIEEPLKANREKYQRLPQVLSKGLKNLKDRLDDILGEINGQRTGLDRAEAHAVQAVNDRTQPKIGVLMRRRYSLDQEEQTELTQALEDIRGKHLQYRLATALLADASVEGVGVTLKHRLRNVGVSSAASVSYWGVQRARGIGHDKATSLVEWRSSVERVAVRSAPQTLSPSDFDYIHGKYVSLRQSIDTQVETIQRQEADEKLRVFDHFKSERESLVDRRIAANEDYEQAVQTLHARCNNEEGRLTSRHYPE